MSKLLGVHQCKNCSHQIKWEYLIPQEYESNWEFTMLDKSRVHAKRVNSKDEEVYRLRVTCRNCLADEIFDYIPDNNVE